MILRIFLKGTLLMSKEVKYQDGNLSQNIQELISCIENFSFILNYTKWCVNIKVKKSNQHMFFNIQLLQGFTVETL